MNHIRRMLAVLVTSAGALLGFTAASPAAFAIRVPPPGGFTGHGQPPPQVQTIVVGGTPGWQIAAIAAGAALLAAVLAVILDRSRAARQPKIAPSA
jgi:hypothetical protein